MANAVQYTTLKNKVNALLVLLHSDLDCIDNLSYADYTSEGERDLIGELSYTLGAYENSLQQIRRHVKNFEEQIGK